MLEIKDLRVSYGNDMVLNGLDLNLADGETLAIIGESGTGKTTLGMSIMRLAEAKILGSICFNGEDLFALSDRQMREIRWNRIALLFQNVNNVLNPVHCVLDQVVEPMVEHKLLNKGEALDKAGELLARFGLSQARFSAYPHQLSGGEQQRVLLAMALANDPELLILDEPLSSLDVTTREELGNLLGEIDGHRAKLVITHDLDTASRLSEKLAVLYGGRIIESGLTQEVLRHPRHPYTRALIRAYPNMTTVKDLQGIKGRMSRPVSGCPFHPRCTQAIEKCSKEVPPLIQSQGRGVACHRGGIVTLLSIVNLSQSFGSLKAVESVSLRIESGETLALVGQSGSGKTTLAKTIMGLHSTYDGTISLESEKVVNRSKDFYKRVQMIFQNPGESLSHRLSVLELVMEPLEVQRIGTTEQRSEKAIQTIGEVELPQTEAFFNTYPHHLSGGELQRVAIARALILDPYLLIADEPTAFLDASVGAKILKLLLNLQEHRGLSMLYITHDIAAARKVSDRIAVMLEGRIIEEGLSNEIVAAPKQAYTKRLLGSASALLSVNAICTHAGS
ncbi:MAG: ABC transporter ATP-binding protein [Chloroflexota bacterium]|nr:ABC transporter ATP-binding protein [Chloroflexota bacterium]